MELRALERSLSKPTTELEAFALHGVKAELITRDIHGVGSLEEVKNEVEEARNEWGNGAKIDDLKIEISDLESDVERLEGRLKRERERSEELRRKLEEVGITTAAA